MENKEKKKIFRISVTLIVIMLLSACCLAGCCKKPEPTPHRMTIEEIRQKTIDEFYDENGKLNKRRWLNDINTPRLTESFIEEVHNLQDITGFDVQLVKDVDGNKVWFLVEFEPFGFFFGHIDRSFTSMAFRCFPSPFKILDIDPENRYIDGNIWGMNVYYHLATMRNGVLIDIQGEGMVDGFYFETEPRQPLGETYDYETRQWGY